jgi:hypothetical protein
MSRLSLAVSCAASFLMFAALSYKVTAAVDEPKSVWLRGYDTRGNEVRLGALRGQVVALTFVARDQGDEGSALNHALAHHTRVLSVVEQPGLEDAPNLTHLSDEAGRLKQAFAVERAKKVAVLVLDREGAVRGRFEGYAALTDALRLVEKLESAR